MGKAGESAGAVGRFGVVKDALGEVGVVVVEGYGDVEVGVLVRLAVGGGPTDNSLSEVL